MHEGVVLQCWLGLGVRLARLILLNPPPHKPVDDALCGRCLERCAGRSGRRFGGPVMTRRLARQAVVLGVSRP